MTERIIDFPDGFESNTTPVAGGAADASDLAFTPAGTISSTNTQAAVEEVSGDVTAHLNDTSDAHDASAISSVASGNLAATDVQAALNELQSDIDTRATSTALTDHISDATDAHAGTAITNTPSGNLAATTVQAALNELQTDVDGRIAVSTVDAKGDLLVGTADNTISRLAVGSNGTFLVADSGEATGLKWAAGGSIGSWSTYTPTFTGFGTATSITARRRLVGDVMEIEIDFTSGTVTSTEARVSLDSGYSTASDYPTGPNICGYWGESTSTSTHGGFMLCEPSKSYLTFGSDGSFGGSSVNPLSNVNASTLASSVRHSIKASVRVV